VALSFPRGSSREHLLELVERAGPAALVAVARLLVEELLI
jgi:hypothetical protein